MIDIDNPLCSSNKSASLILSSTHGRLRRAQRLIAKKDLEAALKHGTCEVSYNQRGDLNWKFTHADIVYITDENCEKEITCWAVPGVGLDLEKHDITKKMNLEHIYACEQIIEDEASWTSHTVIVVDQSGSMRKTDVEGGASRSDAVWLTIAVDFVAKRLESKEASSTDVVSVVEMGNSSKVVVDRKPHDWILYNTFVDLLRTQECHFDGNYLPALDAAENLLLSNTYGNCALTLLFLSDGKPSDHAPSGLGLGVKRSHMHIMGRRIDRLASRFGRRLSVITVGFAGLEEDFSVLQKLASRPAHFQSQGRFFAAQLNQDILESAFSSISSSLYRTCSELTGLGGSSQRVVRDIVRRDRDAVGKDFMPDKQNWLTYNEKSWNHERLVYSHKNHPDQKFMASSPLSKYATGIALARGYFGEGAERIVREFREIGPNGAFVGPKLVAKEGRFQVDITNTNRSQIESFHKRFCDSQERAQGLARIFNQRLEMLPGYDKNTTPKISFLDCSVYIVNDKNLGERGVLVEKLLQGEYKKWNDNRGSVDGQNGNLLGRWGSSRGRTTSSSFPTLDVIEEEDEEEDDDEDEEEDSEDNSDEEMEDSEDNSDEEMEVQEEKILVEDIPQAFSHFTYRYTKRKLLVCDLQGVLTKSSPPLFELTDPVIHFRSRYGKKNVFGRTDRGRAGVEDFFRTHKCSPLCRMLMKRWVRRVGNSERCRHIDGLDDRVSNVRL